jgi:hypothetical protein
VAACRWHYCVVDYDLGVMKLRMKNCVNHLNVKARHECDGIYYCCECFSEAASHGAFFKIASGALEVDAAPAPDTIEFGFHRYMAYRHLSKLTPRHFK